MDELTLTANTTWEDIDLAIHELPLEALRREYRVYHRLCAKISGAFRLEMLLENEIHRRSMSMSEVGAGIRKMSDEGLKQTSKLYFKLNNENQRIDQIQKMLTAELTKRKLSNDE